MSRSFDPIDAMLRDKLSGASALRKQKRDEELEHARKLAAIRAEPHGPVWTGTPEQLVATVTHWYESGWIVAKNLDDALRRVGAMLVREDGSPVLALPTALATVAWNDGETGAEISRSQFVARILDEKGWSPFELATEALLDPGTVMDYINGKTKTYRSTRAKLAKALGVAVERLPK